MNPLIKIMPVKKLIGKRMKMSLANNRTFELWKDFMPRREEIKNKLTADLFSIQVYDKPPDFKNFDPHTSFEKWAAIEVAHFDAIPHEMETLVLTGGMYAVFSYKGLSTDIAIFQHIFGTWLPSSGYLLDHRPHFEILGEKYKNNHPDSEEEIWVPIKKKYED